MVDIVKAELHHAIRWRSYDVCSGVEIVVLMFLRGNKGEEATSTVFVLLILRLLGRKLLNFADLHFLLCKM